MDREPSAPALSDRVRGEGWLVLVGGGEFSFGETARADRAWLDRTPAGTVGFLPTASGSDEYGGHFAAYLGQSGPEVGREVRTVPVYRRRDARRGKNVERLGECAAAYLGGGIADRLLEVFDETPFPAALEDLARQGGVVVGIAAAAQAFGAKVRSLTGRDALSGLAWLPRTAVATNFDPAHDRRLRELVGLPGMRWGIGLPAGSALLFGPQGRIESVGPVLLLDGAEADWQGFGSLDLDDSEEE